MSSPVVTVVPTASVADAARLMWSRKLGWLAVVEDAPDGVERLVGVVGRSDLLKVFTRDDGDLRDEILDSLYHRLGLRDPRVVGVEVDQGVVRLSGHLPTLSEARLVTEFVERLEGVVSVIHGLTYATADTPAVPYTGPIYWMYGQTRGASDH